MDGWMGSPARRTKEEKGEDEDGDQEFNNLFLSPSPSFFSEALLELDMWAVSRPPSSTTDAEKRRL